jgi:mono/diheme cytochrome c family protein
MDERVRFVARLLEAEKMAALCREFAISRKTGYKIFDRYKRSGLAVDAVMGRAPAAERGRKIFVPTCGFCHGNNAHGKSGPYLVRSALVLHDNKGDVIGPVIRNGRLDRGMPAFSGLTEQIQRATPLP